MEARTRIPAAVWVAAGTLFLVQVVWTNLTGLGIGKYPLTYDTVALPRLAVAVIGTLLAWALVFLRMRRKGGTLRFDITWALLGGLAAWAVVSALASEQGPIVWLGQSERLEGVVTIALYAVLFGLGLQLGREESVLRVMAWTVVAGTGVLALIGATQALGLDSTSYAVLNPGFGERQAFASLDNPNFLAAHIVLALPIVAARAVESKTLWKRAIAWLVVVVSVGVLLTTASQGAWLAAVVECAAGLALWLRSRRGNAAEPAPRTFGPIVAGVLVATVGLSAIVLVSSTGANLGRSMEETATARLMLARVATDAAAEHPLVGYGPDTYLAAFRRHRTHEYEALFGRWSTNNNAHFWILQYLATLGVPGALLLVAALATGLVHARPRHTSATSTALAAAVWVGLLGFVLQSMLNVAMLGSTVPFWLLLGLVCSDRARESSLPQAAPGVAAGAAVVLACVALALGARLVSADAMYLRSRLAYNGDASGDAVVLADRASYLNPLSVKYARGAAQAREKDAFGGFVDADATSEEVRALYGDAQAGYERVLAVAPNDYAALAWSAALDAAAGTRLEDPALHAIAVRTAIRAAALDSSAWQVEPIASGDVSSTAIETARSVPALP